MEDLQLTKSDLAFTPDGKLRLAGAAELESLKSVGEYDLLASMPVAPELLDFVGPLHTYNCSVANAAVLFEGKFAMAPEGLQCVECEIFATIGELQLEGGPDATNCGQKVDWKGISRAFPELLLVMEQAMFDLLKEGCPAIMNEVVLPNLGGLSGLLKFANFKKH